MRWPWPAGTPVGKVVGVVTLVLFLSVATLARVDAARHPEREWTPSLAELPNPAAAPVPEVGADPVPVDADDGSLRIDLGAGLSRPGDAVVVTLPQLPSKLKIVLDGAEAKGRLSWNPAHSEYVLASFAAADDRLVAIERYPSRARVGEVSLTLVLHEDQLTVWVESDRIGKLALGSVGTLTVEPADQLHGLSAQQGRVRG